MIQVKKIQRSGWPWFPGVRFRDVVNFNWVRKPKPSTLDNYANELLRCFDMYKVKNVLVIKTVEGSYVLAKFILDYALYGISEKKTKYKSVERVLLSKVVNLMEVKVTPTLDREDEVFDIPLEEIEEHDKWHMNSWQD